jgi:hypothetical protein
MDLERGAQYNPGSRAAAQSALENAARVYSEGYKSLATVRPSAASSLEPAIDLSQAHRFGSITALPVILLSRIGYLSTWVYLLLALFFDFFLIFLFAERSRRTLVAPAETGGVEDLQFLWVEQER